MNPYWTGWMAGYQTMPMVYPNISSHYVEFAKGYQDGKIAYEKMCGLRSDLNKLNESGRYG